jgi:carbamoyl-phosphate synthase small subunit
MSDCPDVLRTDDTGVLTLETGHKITGFSFGAKKSMGGELVFNTGMVGYPESLTDPSYCGQILVFTYPLIGNYGVPSTEEDEFGILKFFESTKVHVAGVIVSDYSKDPSHWNSVKTLGAWLKEWDVPALYGVDTRMLTKKIRENGSMLAKIEFGGEEIPFYNPNLDNLVERVSRKEPKKYNPKGSPVVVAYDCGMKNNIIREFLKRGVCLWVVPFDFDIDQVYGEFDGVFVSNGPGDPVMAQKNYREHPESVGAHQHLPRLQGGPAVLQSSHPLFWNLFGKPTFGVGFGGQDVQDEVREQGGEPALCGFEDYQVLCYLSEPWLCC